MQTVEHTKLPFRGAHGLHHPDGQCRLQDGNAHVGETQRTYRETHRRTYTLCVSRRHRFLQKHLACVFVSSPALMRMYGSFNSVSNGVPSTL